jgi:hypothetical protein
MLSRSFVTNARSRALKITIRAFLLTGWAAYLGGFAHAHLSQASAMGVFMSSRAKVDCRCHAPPPLGLDLCETTIHKQFRPRDVAAVVGREKHDGFRDLIGCAEPAKRQGPDMRNSKSARPGSCFATNFRTTMP